MDLERSSPHGRHTCTIHAGPTAYNEVRPTAVSNKCSSVTEAGMLMVKVRKSGKKSFLFGGSVRLEDMEDAQRTFTKRCNAFFFCRADFPTDKKTVLNARHEGRKYAAMTCRNHGEKNGKCQPRNWGGLKTKKVTPCTMMTETEDDAVGDRGRGRHGRG